MSDSLHADSPPSRCSERGPSLPHARSGCSPRVGLRPSDTSGKHHEKLLKDHTKLRISHDGDGGNFRKLLEKDMNKNTHDTNYVLGM